MFGETFWKSWIMAPYSIISSVFIFHFWQSLTKFEKLCFETYFLIFSCVANEYKSQFSRSTISVKYHVKVHVEGAYTGIFLETHLIIFTKPSLIRHVIRQWFIFGGINKEHLTSTVLDQWGWSIMKSNIHVANSKWNTKPPIDMLSGRYPSPEMA